MLFVHQMSKVASHAWLLAAKETLKTDDAQILHCHFMVPSNRERMTTAVKGPSAVPTISNMVMLNETLRRGAAAWERVLSARQTKAPVRVITGMRDPVARSISIIMYMADFLGHVNRALNPRVALTPEYVIEYLRENWRLVLEREEPQASFEWLLWYLTGAYRTWFAEELQTAFGVEVQQGRFDFARGCQRISTPTLDLLVFRVEDMQPAAPAYRALLTEASAFLQAPLQAFPTANTSSARRSREVSEAVRARFSLPGGMLREIYDNPVTRHFYTEQEIANLVARWRD
jgi:Putative capsular polysaccharide synthesis protein